MKKILILIYIYLNYFVAIPFIAAQSVFFVDAVNGDNNNSGTSSAEAFKTIAKARDIVRSINSNMTSDIIILPQRWGF